MSVIAPDAERYRLDAFSLALQYYAAGRFAVASHFAPVSGSLLHHAIEMFLKGSLAPVIGVPELRHFSHNLEKIWVKFRASFSMETLAAFDSLIHDLHQFEQIRYPESAIKDGASITIGFLPGQKITQNFGEKVPEYNLAVADVDRLVKAIFSVSNVNPQFFSSLRQEHAARYFSFMNESPLV